jgi:hypothetical protein
VVFGVVVRRGELSRCLAGARFGVRQVEHVHPTGRPDRSGKHRREVVAEGRDLDDAVTLLELRELHDLGRLAVEVARTHLGRALGRGHGAANVRGSVGRHFVLGGLAAGRLRERQRRGADGERGGCEETEKRAHRNTPSGLATRQSDHS